MKIDDIAKARSFNRYYTNILGLLDNHILKSDYSLPEARIMFELFRNKRLTASDIVQEIQIDKGYLSRIIRKFVKNGIIVVSPSLTDKRAANISLSKAGIKKFQQLNAASNDQISNILVQLDRTDVKQLLHCMENIQAILTKVKFSHE